MIDIEDEHPPFDDSKVTLTRGDVSKMTKKGKPRDKEEKKKQTGLSTDVVEGEG